VFHRSGRVEHDADQIAGSGNSDNLK
jgi:hypothetical protein